MRIQNIYEIGQKVKNWRKKSLLRKVYLGGLFEIRL